MVSSRPYTPGRIPVSYNNFGSGYSGAKDFDVLTYKEMNLLCVGEIKHNGAKKVGVNRARDYKCWEGDGSYADLLGPEAKARYKALMEAREH